MPDRITAFAPGRINLVGEHTDYNGGLALPFAIAGGVTVHARPLAEPFVEAVAADLGEADRFSLREPLAASGWRSFVRGVVAELQRSGLELCGAVLEITGTVQPGSGLSSSAALEVALCLALVGVSGSAEIEPLALARICSRVENEWVGARTGLLDQIASLSGEEGRALRIDFRSLSVQPVALELGDYRLVTLDSREQHAHASGGYNVRRAECARACAELGIEVLRDADAEMAERLPSPLRERVLHVLTENERVDAVVAALACGDLDELGRLLDASHASLRDLYEVSTPAVEATVERLRAAGAIGARIVGGGFGGNVLGLLPPGAQLPAGALEVFPCGGARVVA